MCRACVSRAEDWVRGGRDLRGPSAGHNLRCVLFLTMVVGGLTASGSSAYAAIVGIVPGSNAVEFTLNVGGTPVSASGVLPLLAYPAFSGFGDGSGDAGFGGLGLAYHFSPAAARVIIPDTAPVAIASQGAPAPGSGPVEISGDFSVAFVVDEAGVAATTIPISYPIAFGGTADGLFVSFEAFVDYTSALAGPLGASTLSFSHLFLGPGGSPGTTVTGPDLALPELAPGDTLTLSGYFTLLADGFPGASTEIEVFGVVPEPSTLTLSVMAIVLGVGVLPRWRKGRRVWPWRAGP